MDQQSFEATYNQFAVSAKVREAALNTAATLDTAFLLDMEQLITDNVRNETNSNEASGGEEATKIYKRAKSAILPFKQEKGTYHALAFALSYFFGACSTVAAGSTGYKHTITPMTGWLESNRSNPTFTAGQRHGMIEKLRYYSGMFKSLNLSFPQDNWLNISGDVVFTGRKDSSMKKIVITALDNITALTLTDDDTVDYAVQGSSAAERLRNISYVRAQKATGEWVYLSCSAASDATPAVLTIGSVGGSGDSVTYNVVFVPTEAAWCTFPSLVEEPSIYSSEFSVILGGKYNGTTVLGGKTIAGEIESAEVAMTLEGADPQFRVGGGAAYANMIRRVDREQKITLNREFVDYLLTQLEADNEEFAIKFASVGAEYESGYNFESSLIWPRCRVLDPKRSVKTKLMAEGAEIAVLRDLTYGSFIGTVQNQFEKYAQAA